MIVSANKSQTVIAIDPGLNVLGFAIFELTPSSSELHYASYIKQETKGLPTVQRIQYVTNELAKQLMERLSSLTFCDHFVIEEPQPFGAYKSLASQQSGSLVKLYLLTGALIQWGLLADMEVHSIPVSHYKGELPKQVVQKRMEKKYETTFPVLDTSDAVFLGDWFCQRTLDTTKDESST